MIRHAYSNMRARYNKAQREEVARERAYVCVSIAKRVKEATCFKRERGSLKTRSDPL